MDGYISNFSANNRYLYSCMCRALGRKLPIALERRGFFAVGADGTEGCCQCSCQKVVSFE